MTYFKTLFFLCLAVSLLSACDSTEPDDEHAGEEELITRITLTLTGGGETVSATANDPDGDGTDFQIETLQLKAGVTYQGSIAVFDDINDANITEEIDEEADEHQFFFTTGGSGASRLTVQATDTDSNQLPIGLEFSAVVSDGGAASATLRVVLSHFDDMPKDGVNQSDETDINVLFPVEIG